MSAGSIGPGALAQGAITLGYAQSTSPQSGITAEVDLTGLSVTVNIPAGGRRIEIIGHSMVNNNTANGSSALFIYEGANKLGTGQGNNTGAGYGISLTAHASFVPSAGSHTYKLRAQGVVGTVGTSASSTTPTYILVKLI